MDSLKPSALKGHVNKVYKVIEAHYISDHIRSAEECIVGFMRFCSSFPLIESSVISNELIISSQLIISSSLSSESSSLSLKSSLSLSLASS